MPARLSLPLRNGFFARLPLAIRQLMRRWGFNWRSGAYRPERHYMRGPGPKSQSKSRKQS
jgi:hypothetical protein